MTDHESGAVAESVIGQARQSVFADLIARLEKATGPDRELDGDIAVAVSGGEIVWIPTQCGEQRPARKYVSKDHLSGYGRAPVDPYTASIDAALTLVPPYHKWSVACGRVVQYVARVTPNQGHGGCFDGECDSTPAIALCIPALKARAA